MKADRTSTVTDGIILTDAAASNPSWPAMSVRQAYAILTALLALVPARQAAGQT